MKHFLLLFLFVSLVIPFSVSAVCKTQTADNCDTVYPGPPPVTTCRDGSGNVTACCDNKSPAGVPSPDNCPISGGTPTPGPGCGNNNQICCPGGICLNGTDTCFNIPDLASFCMNSTQIAAQNTRIKNEKDNVSLGCGSDLTVIRTALGCIPTSPKGLIGALVSWAAGLGSGVALIMIFYAGFTITTAGGDVKKVNSAKHTITYAVIGLAIIILALVILNFVGVRLFGLNNFGFGV